jgi:hypothetical protein
MSDEIEIARAVASDEQERIASGIGLPPMINFGWNDDIVTGGQSLARRAQDMSDLPAEDDCIFSVRVPVQFEARSGGKSG